MPARARRAAAPEAETTDATVTNINRGATTPHTERTKHILTGHLTDEPRRRRAGQDREVTEFHMAGDGPDGPASWTVTVWGARGEEAWSKLEKGDSVKVMGQWEPDYQGANGTKTHQMTASVSIGVEVPGKNEPVPLGAFDRSMLTALETPALEVGLADSAGLADAGGMSAAD
jgi:hypothetical protein